MDALSDVLRSARLTGGVFLHAEFSAPWCMAAKVTTDACAPHVGPDAHLIPYHYVLEGTLRASVAGAPEQAFHSGEVVLLPHNDPHLMGSDLSLEPTPAQDVVQRVSDGRLASIVLGGGGDKTRLVCGYLGADPMKGSPVFGALPPILRFDAREGAAAAWIRSTFFYAADEIAGRRTGAGAMLGKVSELLFVEAVRRYADALPEDQTGWLAGLRDSHVAHALALMHGRLAERWTVDRLGREVGLSRSALADRFAHLIGQPPMNYLADWRMRVAAQQLAESDEPLIRIALAVGYDSEAAFARAFRRIVKAAPAAYRHEARAKAQRQPARVPTDKAWVAP